MDCARTSAFGTRTVTQTKMAFSLRTLTWSRCCRRCIRAALWRLRRPVEHFQRRNLTWTGCNMASASLLRRVGGFCETLMQAEDTHLWIRLALHADLWFCPTVIALCASA